MGRPRIESTSKKVNLTLTVSPEIKDMLQYVRAGKGLSISELVEEYVRKEYKKLQKTGGAPEEQVVGQMDITDVL